MPTYTTEPQTRMKFASEVLYAGLSFSRRLRAGILLTGVPTVVSSPAGPTIANIAVNATAVVINGVTAAVGEAVMFSVSGGTANNTYELTITCGTTGSPAETLIEKCGLEVF